MTQLEWFKKEFIPNATDFTIAQIMFLFQKFGKDIKEMEQDEIKFIEDLMNAWKSTEVGKKASEEQK